MPRNALQRLATLAVRQAGAAAQPRLASATVSPTANLWTLARGPCSSRCTCAQCATTLRSAGQHTTSCPCGACLNGATLLQQQALAGRRGFATLEDSQEQLDIINDRFSEAREEISIAQEDAETTYFDESHAEAKKVVDETLKMFNDLLASLDEAERGKLQRQMGMKMEQLKAEFSLLDELHND